ncbi:hypothetical protein PTHTG4_17800 [Parageobacillus thermoglucosidasius]|nr:hypothetical protein PTHTG4_17800 [Parageobacillus thermoglucosidasius]
MERLSMLLNETRRCMEERCFALEIADFHA